MGKREKSQKKLEIFWARWKLKYSKLVDTAKALVSGNFIVLNVFMRK